MQTKKQVQRKAIKRLVWRNVRKNRAHTLVLVLAVMSVAALMTVLFGAGISVAENMQQADLRMKGSTANAFLMGASPEEMEKIADLRKSAKWDGSNSWPLRILMGRLRTSTMWL